MADPLAMLGGASIPPGVTPEDYASYLQAARRAQLSQALMQSSLSPVQQPQVGGAVRGLYVQPRVGALSAASKLGEALMGRKAADEAIKSEANLGTMLNQAYQPGGQVTSPGTPITAEAPPSDPNSQDVTPLVHRLPGASLEQTAAAAQPTFSPVNPRNPMGLPADVARNLAMNPATQAEYAKMVAGPEAVQLAVRGGQDPGQAARDALLKATEISMRPGSTSRIGGEWMTAPDPSRGETYITLPNGQVIAVPIAGSADIQAHRAGLTTAAEKANTPIMVPQGSGSEALGYPPTPPALRPQPPGPAAAGPANAAPTPSAGTAPNPTSPASAPAAATAPTRSQAPASAAPAPAAGPDAGFFSTAPKMSIPHTPGQSSDLYTTGRLGAAKDKLVELTNTYGQDARLANTQLNYNAQALRALPSAEIGPMSEWLTTNRARLIELGVPPNLIPESGTVTPTFELNKYLKNAALQGAKQIYGPRMTQTEVKLQTEEMSPSASMTADAIRSLIGQSNMQANYAKQRSADFRRYINGNGDPMQFEDWYENGRPLSRFAAQAATPTTPGRDGMTPAQRLAAHPETLPDFVKTFGWDPTK